MKGARAILILALLLAGVSLAHADGLKEIPTVLGPAVTVPAEVPDKPDVPPYMVMLGGLVFVVYGDPATGEPAYVEVYDMELERTVAIMWKWGGVMFQVRDEGIIKKSSPTGNLIFPPPPLRDTV